MDRAALGVTAAGLALLLVPVVYFGELGVWGFSEPISNLDWDEGGLRPDQAGGTTAGSGGGSGGGDPDPEPEVQGDPEGGSGGGSGGDEAAEPAGDSGSGGSGGSDGAGGSDSTGGSGSGERAGGSGSASGDGGGSGGSGTALGVAGSGPDGSGGDQTGSGAFGSQGSAPAFHWPAFAFGSLSFVVLLGGCAWWWGNAFAAFWLAFAQAMAMWAVALCLGLALLLYYVLWAYLGLLGGIAAAGLTLALVYLHSQGMLFGGSAAAAGMAPAAPPAGGEPKAVQRMPKRPR